MLYLIHCEGGSDRTGEVSGAYAMHYLNYTGPQANDWDTEVAERKIHWNSMNGLRWYCYYLTEIKSYSNLNCEGIVD